VGGCQSEAGYRCILGKDDFHLFCLTMMRASKNSKRKGEEYVVTPSDFDKLDYKKRAINLRRIFGRNKQ